MKISFSSLSLIWRFLHSSNAEDYFYVFFIKFLFVSLFENLFDWRFSYFFFQFFNRKKFYFAFSSRISSIQSKALCMHSVFPSLLLWFFPFIFFFKHTLASHSSMNLFVLDRKKYDANVLAICLWNDEIFVLFHIFFLLSIRWLDVGLRQWNRLYGKRQLKER